MAREVDIMHRYMGSPRVANKIIDDIQEQLSRGGGKVESVTAEDIEQIVIYGEKTNGDETE